MLILHPHIGQVAVIGVPDADKGEVVKAFVVPSAQARAPAGVGSPNELAAPQSVASGARSARSAAARAPVSPSGEEPRSRSAASASSVLMLPYPGRDVVVTAMGASGRVES